MKQQLLKSGLIRPLFLLLLLLGVGGQAWGETVTDLINNDATAEKLSSTASTVWVDEYAYTTSTGATYRIKSMGTKSSSNALQFNKNGYIYTTASGGKLKSITVKGTAGKKLNIFAQNQAYVGRGTGTALTTLTLSADGVTYTFEADYTYVSINGTEPSTSITSLEIIWEVSGSTTETCATPTFSPTAGAVAAGTEVTISSTTEGATIYYTTDGSDPTTSSTQGTSVTINEACTVKAIAVADGYDNSAVAEAAYTIRPTISGYTIDFENDVESYVDWTFNNIGTSNTDITAHGGSKYGANINASGNGVATASIQTKEPIALPNTFTCYVSKASTNTTASTWIVQVSSDGSEWTDVGDGQSAATMTKGTWVEYTVNLSGYSNVFVKLSYGSSGAIRTVDDISITMRDPDEKITPTVAIDASGLTIDLAGSTNVSAGTATATVMSGETAVEGAVVTWSSSNTGVATIDASTGAVTLIAVGTTTLTATFAGNDDYNEATDTYELTVIDSNAPGGQNNPYTVAQALAAAPTNDVYVQGIVSRVYSTAVTNSGQIRYYISDDGTERGEMNVYNGLGLYGARFTDISDIQVGDHVVVFGNITVYSDANQLAAGNYLVSLSREKQDPTITVSDVTVAYGSTFTFDASNVEGGDVTLTSSITKVATVNGLTITPKAVGTTTITVATAENISYNAGSATFTLTVTAPKGQTTAAPTGGSGDFVKVTSTADITSGEYLIVEELGEYAYAFNGGLTTLDAVSNNVEVVKNGNTITGNETANSAIFTIDVTAGTIKSASGYYIGKTANSNGLDASTTEAYTNTFAIDANGDAVITASGGCTLRFNANSDQDRFRYYKSGQSSIQLYKRDSGITISYTIPDSGIGTFCSEYPLDLSNLPDGVEAYAVESQTGTSVTLTKITTAVTGGTGLIIKGTGGYKFNFASVGCSTAPKNLLVGTIAPTYVAANTVYGLKSGQFHPNNAGTIPAHRAYLHNPTNNVKALVLQFNDATGITETRTVSAEEAAEIFNLAGQRLSKPTKGINIINGKKVAVK